MPMINLKRKGGDSESDLVAHEELYPYGFALHVNDDLIDELGLEGVQLGDELRIEGKVKVTSVSAHEESNGKSQHLTLQITDVGMRSDSQSDHAGVLYDD